jgi:hypothetical protein
MVTQKVKNMTRYPAVYVLIVWLAFSSMHGYYFLLDVWNTPNPSYLPLFCFVAIQAFALFLAVIVGGWRFIRGPQRIQTAAWLSLGFLPVFIWYSQVSLSFQIFEERRTQQVEMSWYLLTTQSIAAALFDGVGRWTLPLHLEGDRVVMFYDSSIVDPKGDLEKMDAFIKEEESYLGITMPTKIHWFRTPLLGMRGAALSYLAIAQPQWSEQRDIGYIDYHEAAHNIISVPTASAVYAGRNPPSLLMEGWAESRSRNWKTLVRKCRELKQSHRALTLREAVSDVYYNQTDYRIYLQGGAFVKVLCDQFGPEKFLELYQHCTRQTFEQDIERIYGLSLEELDALYWHEIESYWTFDKATENCSPEEKALLEEFREAYERQMQNFYRLTQNGTLETVTHSSTRRLTFQNKKKKEMLFQAREGQLFRIDERTKTISKYTENEEEREVESSTYVLLTPDECISLFNNEEGQRNSISPQDREYWQQIIKRKHLKMFLPFSLFDTLAWHQFTNPNDYLWEPSLGTVVQSVIVEGDIVVLTLTMVEANNEA